LAPRGLLALQVRVAVVERGQERLEALGELCVVQALDRDGPQQRACLALEGDLAPHGRVRVRVGKLEEANELGRVPQSLLLGETRRTWRGGR
jgi:hypothetical protein